MLRAVRQKERHALLAARDERPLRAKLLDELPRRIRHIFLRIEAAFEGGGEFRIVLLHIVDACEGAHVVARIDDRRNATLAAGGEEAVADALRERPRAIVAQDDGLGLFQRLQKTLLQQGSKRRGQGLAALLVDAHDLLADRRPAACDHARLGNRRPLLRLDESSDIDSRRFQHRRDAIASRILAQDAEGAHRTAQRRSVVRDIRRAACDNALVHLFQHEHGRFPRYARDAPIEVDVSNHVAEDEDAHVSHGGSCRYQTIHL